MRLRTLFALLTAALLVAATLWLGWGDAPVPVPGWVRWLLLAAWIGAVVGGVSFLLRAVPVRHRLFVWCALLLLLLGMVLPPEWLQAVSQWLGARFGPLPALDMGGVASALAHVALYAAFAASLLWVRGNQHPAGVLLALAGFAVATELMQLLVDGRSADPFDVALNLSGIAGGAIVAGVMARFALFRRALPSR